MSIRKLNLAGFLICAGLMAYALYSQYALQLEPCPLCIFQRIAVIGLGLLFLLGALMTAETWGRYVYAFFYLVIGGFGIAVAGRHVWLQHLPADEVPACGPGLSYMLDSFPLGEALSMVFSGSGECADVDWDFLGFSMPEWVLAWIVLLTLFGLVNSLRKPA